MAWREWWQATVANVRALFGAPPLASPPVHMRVAPPRGLPGPVQTRVLAAPDARPLDATEPDAREPDAFSGLHARPTSVEPEVVEQAPMSETHAGDPDLDDILDEPLDEPNHDHPPVDDPVGGDAGDDDFAQELLALLESLLFVAAEPADPTQLAQALDVDAATLTHLLARLDAAYRSPGRGLRLQQLNGKVQLVTAPEAAAVIERFLNLDTGARLSGPALETLSVIAYRQPVTRIQIEAVRGVDCAGVLRSLTQRGLVTEVGRQETVGRPILYGVTELFMQHFGLLGLGDLPPLEETEADRLHAALDQHDPPRNDDTETTFPDR